MKDFKKYLKDKEKNKIEITEKTPFRDFIEEREDTSFKITDETPDLFILEDKQLKYKNENNEYTPFLNVQGEDGPVRVIALEDRIIWRYTDKMVWNTIDVLNENLLVEDGFIEYKTEDNWAKISLSKELLPEEAGIPGRDGKDGRDGIDGKDGRDGIDGKRGLRGKVGPQGPIGPAGKDGINGKDGRDGKNGKDGRPGRDGKDGKNGLDGTDGKPGKDGKIGPQGPKGEPGKDGKMGPPGRDGKDGKNGKDGRDGKEGKQGPRGIRGERGLRGLPGKDGKDGSPGPQGPPGREVILGEGITIIEGKRGRDGLDGAPGKIGPPGRDGKNGKDGKDGKDGRPGKQGKTGPPGRDGKDGREIELRNKSGIISWRYKGEDVWEDLLDLTKKTEKDKIRDIVKNLEKNDPLPSKSTYGFNQFPMLPGMSIGAPGPAGPGVEMQVTDENILQWRTIGTSNWINLIDLDTLSSGAPAGEGITISDDGVELGSGISKLNFLTDGEISISNGVANITLGEDMKYTKLVDFDGDYIYKGEANPGTSETDSTWRISRTYIDPITDDIEEKWAEGVISFDKIWNDRLTYNYS